MKVAVLGHRGMLGRRVLEKFPDAITFGERFSTDGPTNPLMNALARERPDWVINCIGENYVSRQTFHVNTVLPHWLASEYRLIQPSTDHYRDTTQYAISKRLGEVGHVIRCAIVDPDGGMLWWARQQDTYGEPLREWNGITAKTWAEVAADVIANPRPLTIPGSPTISHFDLLETARRVFGWKTRTIEGRERVWKAETPTLMFPPIAEQLAEYV